MVIQMQQAVSSESEIQSPSLQHTFPVWAKIGLLSFGGPAAQIALMHRIIVDEKKWLNEQQYLNALSFCMLLPGPEAMQLATYVGWRLNGTIGGLIAGLMFVLPGAAVVLALSIVYAYLGQVPLIGAIFLGVKAAVLMIVIEALLRVSKRALSLPEHWVISGLTFIGIFFLTLPYPLIIFLAAVYGFLRGTSDNNNAPPVSTSHFSLTQTLKTLALWLAIWWVPLLLLGQVVPGSILNDIGIFFSKLAVVTFGGAYAVLAYMGQEVVRDFGWLQTGEMIDGLGLAETTPGPLILVTEFVGFLAAFRDGGLWLGLAGALVTLWVTFTPCFLWIFVGAPYIEWITAQPRLKGALNGITAAVVGVILNLSVWFAVHVFFSEVATKKFGPVSVMIPSLNTLDWRVIVLAALCAVLMFRMHWQIWQTLLVASVAGGVFALV